MLMNLPKIREEFPLKELCTLAIGGPARYLVQVSNAAEMQAAIKYSLHMHLPYMILGKGSNCLFDDSGFNGLVIHNKINFCTRPGSDASHFHVGSGYSYSLLGSQTARQGWGGLEFASGIPATVGGAIYMNAGANGSETSDTLFSVDYVDEKGDLKLLLRDEIHFSYRHSSFQNMQGAIVGATFQLKPIVSARQKQLEIIAHRKKTQPYNAKSAGCIFQNPDGNFAGKLIEECGLKGINIGDAEVSTMHANFLINRGNATSNDLLLLINHIKQKVRLETGIELQSELRIIPHNYE